MTNSQLDTTNESREVSPFPAGDHKAHINRRAQRHNKHKTEKNHTRSTKEKQINCMFWPIYNCMWISQLIKFKPSSSNFYWPFQGGTFVDHLCYLCLVFYMLSRLFIAALWSPAGKGLTFWLFFVMLNCVFVTFPCDILGQVWYLIVLISDLCRLSYLPLQQDRSMHPMELHHQHTSSVG